MPGCVIVVLCILRGQHMALWCSSMRGRRLQPICGASEPPALAGSSGSVIAGVAGGGLATLAIPAAGEAVAVPTEHRDGEERTGQGQGWRPGPQIGAFR